MGVHDMVGGQDSTGNTVDIYKQEGATVLHKQVERRGGRTYMRLRKLSLSSLLGA